MHVSDSTSHIHARTQEADRLEVSGTSYLDVLNHPRFPLARRQYMQVILEAHATDPIMRHFSHEFGRIVLFNVILGHHARMLLDPASPPLTVGRLRDIFMPFRLASPRSFDQMLARMQTIGLITIDPIPDDRRRKLVIPTQKMIEEDLSWLADHMSPLSVLYPERDDYEPARLHDIRYQRAQRMISTQNYAVSRDILDVSDPILILLQRQDASKILYLYMCQAEDAGTPYRATLTFEQAALSTSTSRTHVRNLLQDLERFDMVKILGRGGSEVELTPAIWNKISVFLAKSLWGHDVVWQFAKRLVLAQEQRLHATNSTPDPGMSA